MSYYAYKPAVFINKNNYPINSHDDIHFYPYQSLTYYIHMGQPYMFITQEDYGTHKETISAISSLH